MRIVVAPDSFKDCLSAMDVAKAMADGILRVLPTADITRIPMADGGQGTLNAVLSATHGRRVSVQVLGPLQEPVLAEFGLIDAGRTAVLEMASASGLELVPLDKRDARVTTTYGTGQLIASALDAGVERIIVGIGGSATNDGGAGMAEALGFQLLSADGKPIPRGGGSLRTLHRIDASNKHPRLEQVRIDVACDVTNPLTGPTGASAVYGPQKGADADAVELLDANLRHFADVLRGDLGMDVEMIPGAGAAGGLGAGLMAFAAGKLQRGVDLVMDAVRLRDALIGTDLCLTGEGAMDFQSAYGKTALGVARVCKELDIPCVALTGAAKGDLSTLFDAGLTACFSIAPGPLTLEQSIESAKTNISTTAEQTIRLFLAARLTNRSGKT